MDRLVIRHDTVGQPSRLLAPTPGIFRPRLTAGALLVGGEVLGTLEVLGVTERLRVPAETVGRLVSVVGSGPVDYGLALARAELEPVRDAAASLAAGEVGVRSLLSGIFYRRAAPDRPLLAAEGARIGSAVVLGLIEQMKTFTEVVAPQGEFEVLRFQVSDGAPVDAGQLIAVLHTRG